jgi:hypothetical protein
MGRFERVLDLREKDNRADADFVGSTDFFDESLETPAVATGHRLDRDIFRIFVNEERVNQIRR